MIENVLTLMCGLMRDLQLIQSDCTFLLLLCARKCTYLSLCFQGLPDCHPRIVVIGALGRCGKGALDMAYKAGIPRYTGMLLQ